MASNTALPAIQDPSPDNEANDGSSLNQLKEWNSGLFTAELQRAQILPHKSWGNFSSHTTNVLKEGTYHGTQLAITELYSRIETKFSSYMDIANLESAIPVAISFEDTQSLFTFSPPPKNGQIGYPPHLNLIPASDKEDNVPLEAIFNAAALKDTASLLIPLIPEKILDWRHADPRSDTIAGIESRNRILRSEKKDIYTDPNVGDRPDWYTDVVFAQQQFTGTNPTTITVASNEWIQNFKGAAEAQSLDSVSQLLDSADPTSFYVQDHSYIRTAVGQSKDPLRASDKSRYTCASVSLFQLDADGKLHPLAIVIDFKESIEKSVVVFNRRLRPSDPQAFEETDWAWRYAKTCAQVSDWIVHELAIHLTHTHFVEEAVIVAAHRAFATNHPVYRLLKPHWLKTLSLNASARSTLVPAIVLRIVGLTENQTYAFINDAYNTFDWTGQYIPNDLKKRGFPIEELNDPKFKNYAYGRNMILMWQTLRNFVAKVLSASYTSDEQVSRDSYIRTWSSEMRTTSGGNMKSFPVISTLDDLIDTITMCIHIASPQHTAVNYLQNYYQSFVINKPPCLCTAPPTSLSALQNYKERDLLEALPVNDEHVWLLASHLPHLLSFRVADDQNLPNYAASLAQLSAQNGETIIQEAAQKLFTDLQQLTKLFKINSDNLDDNTVAYDVMSPSSTAVSILI